MSLVKTVVSCSEMTNGVMEIRCSEENTHDAIVSDITGNICSEMSTESL